MYSRLRELIRLCVAPAYLEPFAFKKGGDTPPAPDYMGIAQLQSDTSRDIANQLTWANRPNQSTPWGNTNWHAERVRDPATGQRVTRWSQRTALNPQLQATLNNQFATDRHLSRTAQNQTDDVRQSFSQPFNWEGLPEAGQAPQTQTFQHEIPQYALQGGPQARQLQTGVQQYSMDMSAPQQTTQAMGAPAFAEERQRIEQGLFDRMAPQHQRQEDATRTMLANQGLTAGSEAYNRELERLHQNQAGERWNALNMGGAEQGRMNQMMLANQGQAFNQDMYSQQAQNAAMASQFGQNLAAGQFGNQAQLQGYGMDLSSGQMNNQALNQMFTQGLQAGQFGNQADVLDFNQDLAAFNAQNQSRQQALGEGIQARNMPLQDLRALQGGPIQQPNMPQFTTAAGYQAPNYMGAAQMGYQSQLDAYNAQQAQNQGFMSGLFGLGGTVLGGIYGGPAGAAAGGYAGSQVGSLFG